MGKSILLAVVCGILASAPGMAADDLEKSFLSTFPFDAFLCVSTVSCFWGGLRALPRLLPAMLMH